MAYGLSSRAYDLRASWSRPLRPDPCTIRITAKMTASKILTDKDMPNRLIQGIWNMVGRNRLQLRGIKTEAKNLSGP
ncbi:MAG: hypothetical protein ACI965_000927 [Paraglaciecola sp.]|jgi:hypothetical protein